ncbi:MAG: GOLPH3/VPS74 family protein [Chloroflexota bacterium]
MLTLYEEFFLISIDDYTGMVASRAAETLHYGLAGAMLSELALEGKLSIEDERVIVLNDTPLGDEKLDAMLATLAASPKQRKATRWINELSERKLIRQVADGLAAKGILTIEKKRYLWVIPYDAYPQQDASAKYWVKHYLRAIVLGGEKPEPGVVALLSLLKACRLLNLVFTKDERKAAANKVADLVQGESYGEAVARTLDEIELAAATAAMATTG